MSPRKALLIANPRTGRYGARKSGALEELLDALTGAGLDTQLALTTAPGHATELAAEAAREVSDIIVAGGDGTINEVLQGIAGTSLRLGIIPRGTANVLARELDLPLDVKAAMTVIARGKTRTIQYGIATEEETKRRRYFFLMAGIGLDASVVSKVRPQLKRRFGKAAFWFSGLSHLAKWAPQSFFVEIEGRQYPATFAAIGNGGRYGGDLAITPGARLDQPEFQVCVINTFSRLRYLSLLSSAMRRGITGGESGVRLLTANRVRATGKSAVQIDGELVGKLPMSFEIAESTVAVFVD